MRTVQAALVAVCLLVTSSLSLAADLLAPPMDTLYANRVQVESSGYLSVRLFNVAIDHKKAAEPATFTIISDDDLDYAAAKSAHPTASGSRTRSVRVALRKELLVKETAVFLKLPTPLKNGKSYSVRAEGLATEMPVLAPALYDHSRLVNDNIRVNQLGYHPDYAKRAYLGQYMGDLGPMPFIADSFEIHSSTGQNVFTGKLLRRDVNEALVGQEVREIDFSDFKTPGTYRIFIPGVGYSYSLVIGPEALNPGFVNLMRGNFHQRCAQAIDAGFSRHVREACHLDDAFFERKVEQLKFVAPKNPPLYPAAYDEQFHSAIRGHHDAGDYGKYTITGAGYVFSILLAMEVFPDKFPADNLTLPSSGNGIPDLLDECKWEIDWLENMQDTDGGVFGVIKPNTGGYEHYMPPAKAHRLFCPKDTVFTGAYAAALAHASRSPLMQKHYPEDAKRYLGKAIKAWEFLERNQRFVQYFHYGSNAGDWDERCWAAAELYAATGDAKYHEYFLKQFRPDERRWGWWGMFESVGNAVNAYLFFDNRPKDPVMLEKCRAALRAACDANLTYSEQHPYRFSMPTASVNHKTYGWYFPGDIAGWDLLMGYALTKDQRYLQCAADNIGYSFGSNPFGYFLQTGLGAKRNIEMVSDVASHDDIIEPVPGIPLGIGSPGFYWLNQYGKRIGEGTYPAEGEWPLMNRWYDGFNVQSEFTMTPLIRETIVAGFFSDTSLIKSQRPRVRIKADRLTGKTPLEVQFDIETTLPADGVRQVFWDFGDESFSTQRNPRHLFATEGMQYPVAVSIIDSNGLWAYATTTVTSQLAKAEFPQEEAKADAKTVMLFHFNGDLKDVSGLELTRDAGQPDLTPMKFSPTPPGWMSAAAGSCIVMEGSEQLVLTAPPALLSKLERSPFTIEMMLYLRKFAGWGYPRDPVLLGFRGEATFGLRQETWDRAGTPKFGNVITSEKFAKEFPLNRWCQVRIEADGTGNATFSVNGKEWGRTEMKPFAQIDRRPVLFSVGPFVGMVDEVHVRTR